MVIILSDKEKNDHIDDLTEKPISNEKNDDVDNDDDYFDKAWNNWSSRRRCESSHRAGKMDQFKKISKSD